MLLALSIIADDDYDRPIYVEPAVEDIEADVWDSVCELIQELIEGERAKSGSTSDGGASVAWRHLSRQVLTFIAVASDELPAKSLEAYLKALSERYLDEVADPRNPERDGVADVVIDIIPPWEDEDDWLE